MTVHLKQLQKDFISSLIDEDVNVNRYIKRKKFSTQAHLQVYQNNFLLNHIDALQAVYPKLIKIIGEQSFKALAKKYVQNYPPLTGCFFEWGGELPSFIREIKEFNNLPYLTDVALYEWLCHETMSAAYVPPIKIEEYEKHANCAANPENIAFKLLPSVRLMRTDFGLHNIMHFLAGHSEKANSVISGSEYIVIWKNKNICLQKWVSKEVYFFVSEIEKGKTLSQIIDGFLAEDIELRLDICFAFVFDHGLLADVKEMFIE